MAVSPAKARVVSGMRPTGQLHLGHLVGALANWVALQEQYDCYYFVADWHALTSDYADPGRVRQATYDAVADWLAAGMDPEKSTIFAPDSSSARAWLIATPFGVAKNTQSHPDSDAFAGSIPSAFQSMASFVWIGRAAKLPSASRVWPFFFHSVIFTSGASAFTGLAGFHQPMNSASATPNSSHCFQTGTGGV